MGRGIGEGDERYSVVEAVKWGGGSREAGKR